MTESRRQWYLQNKGLEIKCETPKSESSQNFNYLAGQLQGRMKIAEARKKEQEWEERNDEATKTIIDTPK